MEKEAEDEEVVVAVVQQQSWSGSAALPRGGHHGRGTGDDTNDDPTAVDPGDTSNGRLPMKTVTVRPP